jgi:integrase
MDIKTHKSLTAIKPSEKEQWHNVVNVPRLFIKQNKGDSGGLAWVFRYNKPISNVASKITLGKAGKFNNGILSVAGVMTLAEATLKANEYNALLTKDIDPQLFEQEKIDSFNQANLHTFEYFANLHYESLKDIQSAETLRRKRGRYDLLIQYLGKYPISEIKASKLSEVFKDIQENSKSEDDEYTDKGERCAGYVDEIFTMASRITDKSYNPTSVAKAVLKPYFYSNRKAITNITEFSQLVRDIEHANIQRNVKNSLKLLTLLFVRNGDLRRMKWQDIDFDNNVWNLQPLKSKSTNKIKMVQDLIIPLPRQAINILLEQKELNGQHEYVFHNSDTTKEPFINTNVSNLALQDIGYKDRHTSHGFRASARSILGGYFKYPIEYTEMALGHIVKDTNGTAYNRWQYLDERREMLQFYADWIYAIKDYQETSGFIPYNKRHIVNDPKQLILNSMQALNDKEKVELLQILLKNTNN